MRTLIMVSSLLTVVTFSGCASFEKRYGKILPGQSRDEVIEVMGPPAVIGKVNGEDAMGWIANDYTGCTVFFSPEAKVTAKLCEVNEGARQAYIANQQERAARWAAVVGSSRAREAAEASRQSTQNVQSFHPSTYRAPTQTRTNCTSYRSGNQVNTDCSSN